MNKEQDKDILNVGKLLAMKLCWYVCVDQQSRAEPSIRREQHLDYDAEEVHNLLVHEHNLLVHKHKLLVHFQNIIVQAYCF